MSGISASESNPASTQSKRESVWSLLDKRPRTSEINSYTSEEIDEIRHITDRYLNLISRLSGTNSALNKESQAFLDATSVVRALSRIAEDKFEQGALDDAAQSVVNAIRWQRFADDLYQSGGVTLSRTNPARLWYLLTEIYVRMGEQELAVKTMRKAGAGISDEVDPSLPALIPQPVGSDATPVQSGQPSESKRRSLAEYSPLRNRTSAILIIFVMMGILFFVAFRAQVATKGMIDNSSEGIDFLAIAYSPNSSNPDNEVLILASREFSALRAKLDSWAWAITLSSIVPPARNQFVAMKRLSALGTDIAAAPYSSDVNSRLFEPGAPLRICQSAERLRSVNGNLLNQLEKNRNQMLSFVPAASGGLCRLD